MFSIITHKKIYYLKDSQTNEWYSSASRTDLKKICQIINELQTNQKDCEQKEEAIKQILNILNN